MMHSGTSDAFGGRGGRLGEKDYQGRIPDQSTPPGWRPNPVAFDPFNPYKGVDPSTGRPILKDPSTNDLYGPFCSLHFQDVFDSTGGPFIGYPLIGEPSDPWETFDPLDSFELTWKTDDRGERLLWAKNDANPGTAFNPTDLETASDFDPAPNYNPAISDTASDTGGSFYVGTYPDEEGGPLYDHFADIDGFEYKFLTDGATNPNDLSEYVTVVAPRDRPSTPIDKSSSVPPEAIAPPPGDSADSSSGRSALDPTPQWVKETVIFKDEVDFERARNTPPAVPEHRFGFYPFKDADRRLTDRYGNLWTSR